MLIPIAAILSLARYTRIFTSFLRCVKITIRCFNIEWHLRKTGRVLVWRGSKESLFTESRVLSPFDGRIVELRAFVAGERLGREQRTRLCSSCDSPSVSPSLHGFDVLLSSRRSREMKALFRRIDKINRVAHDNADNFATIRTRPASGARTNKYALAGNARKTDGRSVGLNAHRVSFTNSVTAERQGESA